MQQLRIHVMQKRIFLFFSLSTYKAAFSLQCRVAQEKKCIQSLMHKQLLKHDVRCMDFEYPHLLERKRLR